jgi:phenylacetate-CoA ligase
MTDINRPFKYPCARLNHYADTSFKKIIQYAGNVPFYQYKYQKEGISRNLVRGLSNIEMFPYVSKDDLRKNFPDGIVPHGFDKNNAHLFTTSGSTGEPVSIYKDHLTVVRGQIIGIRMYKANGIDWKHDRIAMIGDFGVQGSYDEECVKRFSYRYLNNFLNFSNMKLISFKEEPKNIMNELNDFRPFVIYTDPDVLKDLATLKNKGIGDNVSPKLCVSHGSSLNPYTRKYVEEIFNCRIIDNFGSSEGGAIAFQCKKGNYHINSDLVHLEVINDEEELLRYDEEGRLVITRLYGRGTPIIRYTGMNDILILSEKKCDCGLNTQLIEKIKGRKINPIILSNGERVSGFAFIQIPYQVMKKLNTDKIKQFQIVQKKIGQIEVFVVIDEELRETPPDSELLFCELQKSFHNEVGKNLEITIKEIKEIKKRRAREYPPLIKSYIKENSEVY